MQRPDEAKRKQIIASATRLFASSPYHAVRLEDVAADAKIGKGTIYVYYASKEDLYLSLIRDGFADMVGQAEQAAADRTRPAWRRLADVIDGLVAFGVQYPDLYRVMRNRALSPDDPALQAARAKLAKTIEGILREGASSGEMRDPSPELTAQFVISFVRGALLYPPTGLTPAMLSGHILHVLRNGIGLEGDGGMENGHGPGAGKAGRR